jgi:asparagine N-glycosylation enzyme membrane subunit Stt3
MDPVLLRTLHIAGAVALFTTFGALFAGNASPEKASMFHGISLLLILLVGFAMLRKPPMGQYWWMVKLGLWLFLGAAPALAKRAVLPRCVVLTLCLAAAVFATWLGLVKPF